MALRMQIPRERIHVTIQDCRSGLLAAYQYLTRVSCLHVNAHLFCLSYRLSTRVEISHVNTAQLCSQNPHTVVCFGKCGYSSSYSTGTMLWEVWILILIQYRYYALGSVDTHPHTVQVLCFGKCGYSSSYSTGTMLWEVWILIHFVVH